MRIFQKFLIFIVCVFPSGAMAGAWVEWKYTRADGKKPSVAFSTRTVQVLRNRLKRFGVKGVFASPTLNNQIRVCIRLQSRMVRLQAQKQILYPPVNRTLAQIKELFARRKLQRLHLVQDDHFSKKLFARMDKKRPSGVNSRIETYTRALNARTNTGYARFFYSRSRLALRRWIRRWNRSLRGQRYKLYLLQAEHLTRKNQWVQEWRTILLYRKPFATQAHIKAAKLWKHKKKSLYAVDIFFSRQGSRLIRAITKKNVGLRVAFVIGDIARKTAVVKNKISQGIWRIPPHSLKTNEQAAQETRAFALLLQTALPFSLRRISNETISAGTKTSMLCRSIEQQAALTGMKVGSMSTTVRFDSNKVVKARRSRQSKPLLPRSGPAQSCLATLHNTQCFPLALFQMLYGQALQNQQLHPQEAKRDPKGSKMRFLNSCLAQVMLAGEALRRRLDVADIDLQRTIERDPSFSRNGQFQQSLYESKRKSWQITDKLYKQWLRIQILAAHFRKVQQKRAFVSEKEAWQHYQKQAQRIQLFYLKFHIPSFQPKGRNSSPRLSRSILRRSLLWLLRHWKSHNSHRLLARFRKTWNPSTPNTAKPFPTAGRPPLAILREVAYSMQTKHKAWQTPFFRKTLIPWLPGMGYHAKAQEQVFALTKASPLVKQPVPIGSFFYLIKLKQRWTASPSKFQRDKEEINHRLRLRKYYKWEAKVVRILKRKAQIKIQTPLL